MEESKGSGQTGRAGFDQQVGIPTVDPPHPAAVALCAQRQAHINAISSVDPRQWDLVGSGIEVSITLSMIKLS